MTTPEAAVKNKIRDYLKAQGKTLWHYCPVHTGMGVAGIPDIVGCDDGWFFGIEVKAPGKLASVRPAQEVQLAAIREAKGGTFLVDNLGVFIATFHVWRQERT